MKLQLLWSPEEHITSYFTQRFSAIDNLQFSFPEKTEDGTTYPLLEEADILFGWSTKESILNQAKRAKYYVVPGTGIQHMFTSLAQLKKENELVLLNSHGNAYATAQHAVSMLFSLTNKIIDHHQFMKDGNWRTGEEESKSILAKDKNIGFLGYGSINKKIHQFLSGFDVAFHIYKRDNNFKPQLSAFVAQDLKAFLNSIDILFIGVPETSTTRGLIGKRELDLLGNEGLLINISRGPIVDEESLFNALLNHEILGAAIDVWYNYKPEEDQEGKRYPYAFPFHELSNLVLSPHRGASPMDNISRFDDCIQNIEKIVQKNPNLTNVINWDLEY